jgi:hypothetical protein
MTTWQRLRYVLARGRFQGWAKARAFYWSVIRRWETEICMKCGRPVRVVWWCHDSALWTRITGNPKPPGSESAAGIWCIYCFDKACRAEKTGWIEWAPLNLFHIGDP